MLPLTARRRWQAPIGGLLLGCAVGSAHAVPSFARQTSLDCMACHVSWPELTPTGRQFKLNGYTLGQRLRLPIAGMLQVSRSATASVDPRSPDSFPREHDVVLQQASLFYSGKLSEHAGIFSQYSYDGVGHHSSIDNVDVRYANRILAGPGPLVYGFTLHNNPLMQDVYNTGATWGFPFASSPVAPAPAAAPAIESLGQQVAGLGAYGLWNRTLYAEVSFYRTADQLFSALRYGADRDSAAALRGYNPYWRVALQREWDRGTYSAMIGAYGLQLDRYPDNTLRSGPVDHFRDIGVDAQYQYLTDRHRITAQLNYLREKQKWHPDALANPTGRLDTFRVKLTYYLEKKYGLNLGYFSTRGSANDALYNTGEPIVGSASGSPNSAGYVYELNYLPKRDIRLTLQYTAYRKFNGARTDYDGFGRNANDNNTLYLLAWFMF